ncbi:MAG: GntR family transcriptional regulator [Actinomycetota bacterium]
MKTNLAPSIHRGAPVPFYAQLAEILREQIANGLFGPGDILPAESELCSDYRLSRTVVRQALNELVSEGLVQKEKGRGTFVSEPKIADIVVQELRGFSEEVGARGATIGTTILRQEIVPSPVWVSEYLGIPEGSSIVHLSRVRTGDGDPIVKVDTYLPCPRFKKLATIDLSSRSLYETLDTVFHVRPGGGWRRIEAVIASRELADALSADIGSPMLELTAVTTEKSGKPFELFRAYYRGDRTSFEVRV